MLRPEVRIIVSQYREIAAHDRPEDACFCRLTRKPRGGPTEIRRAVTERQKMHKRHRPALGGATRLQINRSSRRPAKRRAVSRVLLCYIGSSWRDWMMMMMSLLPDSSRPIGG